MSWPYWLKRFVLALVMAGAVLFIAQRLKGHAATDAAAFATLWSTVFAGIFTGIGYVRYRRNPACMVSRTRRD
ncbi:MAG TPA: hypothetical protein VJL61_12840 [Rhodanobacteraceae bacterium]|nr:hypothetical protein [Rhodanobacteraceae bacterium]